jgi:ribonuclease P protein component
MRADIGAETGGQVRETEDRLILHAPSPAAPARFGFTATKKLGNAVTRNLIRRRLKEAVRLVASGRARAGCDYVLIARAAAATRSFAVIERDLATAFDGLHEPAPGGQRPSRHETRGGTRPSSTRGRAGSPRPASEG